MLERPTPSAEETATQWVRALGLALGGFIALQIDAIEAGKLPK